LFGTRRSDGSGSSRREVMNEFMAEWDGLTSNNNGVVVLGATNRPFDLDDAILRRMPRRILIDMPNQEARLEILKVHLKDEDLSMLDLKKLSEKTINYSGSDLRNLCVSAALTRIKTALLKQNCQAYQEMNNDEKENFLTDSIPLLKDSDGTVEELGGLTMEHFATALKECPPSTSEDMETLKELRKWDGIYGDGAALRKKKGQGIGFDLTKIK
jgi:SpoVK/Ycf46/Vps4 family AAA+-type ATPase